MLSYAVTVNCQTLRLGFDGANLSDQAWTTGPAVAPAALRVMRGLRCGFTDFTRKVKRPFLVSAAACAAVSGEFEQAVQVAPSSKEYSIAIEDPAGIG